MAVTAGSVWVQGDYLHFAASTTTNYRYLGTFVALRSTGNAGSMWIDGANLRYLDSTLNERYLPLGSASTPTGVTSAINGSVWIENNRLNSVEGTTKQKREYHADAPHQDVHGDTAQYHGDSPHDDIAHDDIAFDNSHSDSHGDGQFGQFHDDTHGDAHGDVAHGDFHSDSAHDDVSWSHYDLTINVTFANAPEFVGTI